MRTACSYSPRASVQGSLAARPFPLPLTAAAAQLRRSPRAPAFAPKPPPLAVRKATGEGGSQAGEAAGGGGAAPAETAQRRGADLLSAAARRLGASSHCREALAGITAELLRAALVGTRPAGYALGLAASPEGVLVGAHEAVLCLLREEGNKIEPRAAADWETMYRELVRVAQRAVGHLLFDLHMLATDLGSPTAALEVADCLARGTLVPQDEEAAYQWCCRAAEMGSADACLKVGIYAFDGHYPASQDGARAYDYFSRALELSSQQPEGNGQAWAGGLQPSTQRSPSRDGTAGEGGDAGGEAPTEPLPSDVRLSALTWIGRCHMDGVGVPRDVGAAAALFRQAGSTAELSELAMLQRQYTSLDLSDVLPASQQPQQ